MFSPVPFALKGSQIPQNKDLTRLCLGNYHRKPGYFLLINEFQLVARQPGECVSVSV